MIILALFAGLVAGIAIGAAAVAALDERTNQAERAHHLAEQQRIRTEITELTALAEHHLRNTP